MQYENQAIKPKKPPVTVYLSATIVFFFLTLSAADSIGFVPYYIDGSTPLTTSDTDPASVSAPKEVALASLPQLGQEQIELPAPKIAPQAIVPDRIEISSIDLDLPVQNPDTTDVNKLDDLLQQGPARYAPSAELNESGNMIIFAHSSHLPIVHNQMFRAFNKIPDLKPGDSITIEGGGKKFLYSVTSVQKAETTDGTTIDLSPTQGTKLTLVTCDTLTGKSARFILKADFVGII